MIVRFAWEWHAVADFKPDGRARTRCGSTFPAVRLGEELGKPGVCSMLDHLCERCGVVCPKGCRGRCTGAEVEAPCG